MHISMRFIVFLSALIYPLTSFAEVRICATNEQIQSFCNTRKVKAVFIFNKKIHFIDFSEENPKVTAIAATSNAIMPVISPDGALLPITEYYTLRKRDDSCLCNRVEPNLRLMSYPRLDFAANNSSHLFNMGSPSAEKAWDGCDM